MSLAKLAAAVVAVTWSEAVYLHDVVGTRSESWLGKRIDIEDIIAGRELSSRVAVVLGQTPEMLS